MHATQQGRSERERKRTSHWLFQFYFYLRSTSERVSDLAFGVLTFSKYILFFLFPTALVHELAPAQLCEFGMVGTHFLSRLSETDTYEAKRAKENIKREDEEEEERALHLPRIKQPWISDRAFLFYLSIL